MDENANVTFSFTIPNLAEIVAAFKSAPSIVAPILEKTLAASEAILAKNTRQNVPQVTGQLATRWNFVQESLVAHWIPMMSYALFVEQGTGIYGPTGARIVPKNAQALYWPGAAHPVRSTAGMKPRYYVEKIIAAATPELTQLFQTSLGLITDAINAQT